MNEQRVNELFEKASRKIKGEGMVRQNVKFDENEEREKTRKQLKQKNEHVEFQIINTKKQKMFFYGLRKKWYKQIAYKKTDKPKRA